MHVHAGPAWARRLGHAHAAFCMGILHGIAGSSHFLGVLPALALPTTRRCRDGIAAFGVGTVIAMTRVRRHHRVGGDPRPPSRGASPGHAAHRGNAGHRRRRLLAGVLTGSPHPRSRRQWISWPFFEIPVDGLP